MVSRDAETSGEHEISLSYVSWRQTLQVRYFIIIEIPGPSNIV